MVRLRIPTWMLVALILREIPTYFFVLGQYTGSRLRGSPIGALIRGYQPHPADNNKDNPNGYGPHPLSNVYGYGQPYGVSRTSGYIPGKLHPCEQSSCYPATGNLLIGRESQLYSSSTCGLHGQQRYCIVSHLKDRKKCFWCDSRPTKRHDPQLNHNISNVIYRMYPGTRTKSWWQSENGKENVYIQLDLEAEFHFTHLIITFKTFRPAAMLIERSYDFKRTWQVYRYFAYNCAESFPHIKYRYTENLTDIVCESRYSNLQPSSEGEVIYRVLPPTLHIDNPYSEQVQNLLKMTNLRINFTKLHTLGDDLLDKREDIQEKYYYAITDMVVRGSCSCYGHANRCLPLPGIEPKPDMVHGRCECTHNTKGRNCEKCEDFFNDLPWRPAIGKQTNACKKCNCNNHATSCHFDPALYEATGRISGGVCDACEHNTMGPNCEQCKPFYYRDPNRDIQDPEVCRPCDCDPHGSLDNGICDSVTDAGNNLEAGSCHCKTNVEGRRCDICKNGFWNFTDSNPDGCQSCTCDIYGTIDNQGCNVYTGECTCKRYVTGRDCNQCLPEYWGLSEKRDGCQPCDCDPGGSYDNFCDVITGQCKCRDHMVGRTCSTPKQQHFTASLDFLLYEAELANTSPKCQVVIKEPPRDGSEITWTGTGFVKAFEKSFIEFTIDNVRTSMDYSIVIKYEPTLPENWQEVDVTLIRPDGVDPNGPCRNARDDVRRISLPYNDRKVTVLPHYCLEAGRPYKVKLSFVRSNYERESPTASVLIDSISLIPRIETIPWFHGSVPAESRLEEFRRNRCDYYTTYAVHSNQIPEVCKKYFGSIGAYIFNGAFSCQCDPTGSVSKLCGEYGGNCTCKPNVNGRRCEKCAVGYYGFGPEGCKACDCNSIGSLDNLCNQSTGQCKCRANTYGRECDQCRTGFWNFPDCQRCDCNGHADICDSRTGACTSCRDNTEGRNCDQCVVGYYGDPRLDVDIPCRPCPCPGIPGSNHSYADRCQLDPYSKDVVCECQEGYSGSRCEICSDNYFGNPEEIGGACQPCNCNDMVDLLQPGNCDPHTGQCKKCLYNTTGDHCEVCQPGFFRYERDQTCQVCICHLLGTNGSAGPCDHNTGQCACLPNVTGLRCDQCIPNHWKIASGEGCESCSCDPQGSLSPQCNEFDGQCECKPGFGGRQCNECMARFYGDPKLECNECQCDKRGSKTLQCDMRTGACLCLPGIGGYNCDKCDRGYLGEAPECTPCGECFYNWDRILQETKNQTLRMIDRAGDIKKVGATGAYTKEFDDMQYQLDEIEHLLSNTDEINVDEIDEELSVLREKINKTEAGKLTELDTSLANTKENMLLTNLRLDRLQNSIENLKNKSKELEINGTQLQEANVQGALTLIQNAKDKADSAVSKATLTENQINYIERQIKATETYINDTADTFQQQLETNNKKLNDLDNKLKELERGIPELNNLICDGHGDPCDSICGGAGCASCGNSISCEEGARQQAEAALNFVNTTETVLREKESMANDFIRNFSQINVNETRITAEDTYNKARGFLVKTNDSLTQANNLQNEIRDFLAQNNTKPEDIIDLANQIFKTNIQLEPDEITDLANKIKDAVSNLQNIEPIIEATKDDLKRVNQLKEDAERAKSSATNLLKNAGDVNKALINTTMAQQDAQVAIDTALADIDTVHDLIYQIGHETKTAQNLTGTTAGDIRRLADQLDHLQRNITDNGIYANRIVNESANILDNAKNTYDNFTALQVTYKKTKEDLDVNINRVQSVKDRAHELNDRALNLVDKVRKTEDEITELENSSQEDEIFTLENQLKDLIMRMNHYIDHIQQRVQHYKLCN